MSPGPNIGGGTCPPCPIGIDAPALNVPNLAPQHRLTLTLYSLTSVDVGVNVSSS